MAHITAGHRRQWWTHFRHSMGFWQLAHSPASAAGALLVVRLGVSSLSGSARAWRAHCLLHRSWPVSTIIWTLAPALHVAPQRHFPASREFLLCIVVRLAGCPSGDWLGLAGCPSGDWLHCCSSGPSPGNPRVESKGLGLGLWRLVAASVTPTRREASHLSAAIGVGRLRCWLSASTASAAAAEPWRLLRTARRRRRASGACR